MVNRYETGRNVRTVRTLMAFGFVSLVSCSGLASHSRGGDAWRHACTVNTSEGCPCQHDKDCLTAWCVNEECARREP